MKNVKMVLSLCVLATLCACGNASVQPTPTPMPAPTSAPVIQPTQIPATLVVATLAPAEASKPTATPKPTDAPKPTEAPKDVEVKSAAELINTVVAELKKAGLSAKIVKRGDNRDQDYNTFNILGAEVQSISMVGQGNVSDGSKYKGLDAKSMQILTEKAIKAFQDEGYDPKDIIICGKPLGSFKYMMVIQNEDIGQAEAQRDALKKNPLFSKAWTPNSGSFEYKGGNFVIRISSQSPEAYDYGNDPLTVAIDNGMLNLRRSEDKYAISKFYMGWVTRVGRNGMLNLESLTKSYNDWALKGGVKFLINSQTLDVTKIKL